MSRSPDGHPLLMSEGRSGGKGGSQWNLFMMGKWGVDSLLAATFSTLKYKHLNKSMRNC